MVHGWWPQNILEHETLSYGEYHEESAKEFYETFMRFFGIGEPVANATLIAFGFALLHTQSNCGCIIRYVHVTEIFHSPKYSNG